MVLDASLLNTQHSKERIKVKWVNPVKGVAPSPTPWCSSYRKGSPPVTLDYGRQLYSYLPMKDDVNFDMDILDDRSVTVIVVENGLSNRR